jgi:hypothetical protein
MLWPLTLFCKLLKPFLVLMLNKFRNKSTGSKTIAEPSPLEKVALIDLNIPSLPNAMATCTEQLSTAYLKTGKLYIYA